MHSLCRLCLRVGPFHIALHRNLFHKAGVDVRWTDIKAGTGALINAAKSAEQDVVVALTEGLIADIVLGSNLRLISSYVESPLVWAISTGGKASSINSVQDLQHQTIAVSRFTSGSHLMTCVLAAQRGWRQDDVKYVVKGPSVDVYHTRTAGCFLSPSITDHLVAACFASLTVQLRSVTSGCQRWHRRCLHVGAVYDSQSLSTTLYITESKAPACLTYSCCCTMVCAVTTARHVQKPYLDSGELRRIGTIVTPWPCFLLAATQSTIDAQLPAIQAMLTALREACQLFHSESSTPADIAAHFHFQPADAVAWFHSVHISAADSIALSAIQKTIAALREARVLPEVDEPVEEIDGSTLVDARLLRVERDIGTMRLYKSVDSI